MTDDTSGGKSVVDVHAHFLPAEGFAEVGDFQGNKLASSGPEGTVSLPGGKRVGPFRPGMLSPEARLADMRAMRITHQVLSVPPFAFFYEGPPSSGAELCRYQNDSMLQMAAADPVSFTVLATLPMQDTSLAVAEIERLALVPAVRGVAIGSNVSGEDLDAKRFEPIWRTLTEADLPLFIHPVTVVGGGRVQPYFLQNLFGNPADTTLALAHLVFGGVLERHPSLRVCLSHGGGFAPYQIGRWNRGWETRDEVRNTLPQPPSTYLANVFCDLIVHNEEALSFLGGQISWSRVLVGTDYPFVMGVEDPLAILERVGLEETDRGQVLTGTSRLFLRGFDVGGQTGGIEGTA